MADLKERHKEGPVKRSIDLGRVGTKGWIVILMCIAGIGASLWWSWDSWKVAVEHWRLTLMVLGMLGLYALSQAGRGMLGQGKSVGRVRMALEDAPTALTPGELVSCCKGLSMAQVDAALRDGIEQGWAQVLGLGTDSLRYRFVERHQGHDGQDE